MIDCKWEYLKTVRSLRAPGEPLTSLRELLEYVSQPGLEHIWILLDIKVDNNADDIMRLIAETTTSVEPGTRPWSDRIVLGCWVPKFLPLCEKYLPGFPISHIGTSLCYAQQFFDVPNCSFNLLSKTLLGPIGERFIRKARSKNREVFAWTINSTNIMKWCIQKELDGVITDDPKLFEEICDNWSDDELPAKPTCLQLLYSFWLYMVIGIFMVLVRIRQPQTVKHYLANRDSGVGKEKR